MLQFMFFACVIIITSLVNHTRTADQEQISPATVFLSNEQYYSYDQRPSPSVGEWYMVWMIYGGHMITGNECGSFSNLSVTLPTSQFILQPFRCFTYITAHSPNSSFASPTSQALHLASRPCFVAGVRFSFDCPSRKQD